MKKLEDLVPELELCKKIPEGAFADSAMVWMDDGHGGKICEPRRYAPYQHIIAPAPTLEEIMDELPKYNENEVSLALVPAFNSDGDIRIFGEAWSVGYTHKCNVTDKKSATAALKLWLELNKSAPSDLSDQSDEMDSDRKGGAK